MSKAPPIPENELKRLLNLSELDLDFTNIEDSFKDLTTLASKVTGTSVSLVNIIDSYTQWTIANYGLDVSQLPREDSICQYTIMSQQPFEVHDMSTDARFQEKFYVDGPLGLRYYYGLPLQIAEGLNIGALCVLDQELKNLTPEKVELLEIIAQTVVKRLKSVHAFEVLSAKLNESNASKKKAAHDIRGPLAGIIGLSELITEQGETGDIKEFMEYISMINKSGKSLLELADEILSDGDKRQVSEQEFNLPLFQDKLIELYQPQAKFKNVNLKVLLDNANQSIPFLKNKLLQIAGNLISNAIKFTPEGGDITVNLGLELKETQKVLKIVVTDNGMGIDPTSIQQILSGKASSTPGTMGEKGYGFGLSLVSHLVETLKGSIDISAAPGRGARFEVLLTQAI